MSLDLDWDWFVGCDVGFGIWVEESSHVQLHGFQGGLFRHDLLDVRLEARVRLQQLLAQAAMHG